MYVHVYMYFISYCRFPYAETREPLSLFIVTKTFLPNYKLFISQETGRDQSVEAIFN